MMIVSGITAAKIQCQDSALTITPETVGPMAGPTEMTIELRPMTIPRCRSGTRVSVVVMSNGNTIAVPTAWRRRASRRTANVGATTANRRPMIKLVSANTNRPRSGKRRRRKPLVGMTTPMVSRNPVVSHCPAAADTP